MMPSFVRNILLLTLAIAALGVGPASFAEVTALTPFEAEYKVKIKGLRGQMTLSLEEVDGGYIARSELKPRGLASMFARGRVEESTRFGIADVRVVPASYTMTDTIGKNEKSGALEFDWASGRATGSTEEGPVAHDIDSATYDRASIQYALMLDLLNGRSATSYTMLDGDRRKALTISHLGDSVLDVPLGRYTVSGVSHQASGSSRMTTLYCASVLGFLPVQIEQYKNDKLQVRAQLVRYTPR